MADEIVAPGDILQAPLKTLSVDVVSSGIFHPHLVSPESVCKSSNDINESKTLVSGLSDAMSVSFTWRPNKKVKAEEGKPHPLKSYLQSAYNKQSLKEALCDIFPNLRDLVAHDKSIQKYPLCLRLFLYALVAMISGLPTIYKGDPWEIVAKAWCCHFSGMGMKDGCAEAIAEFLDLRKETMNSERKSRMEDFIQNSTWSLNWDPNMKEK